MPAAQQWNLDLVMYLIEKGVSVEKTDYVSIPPLLPWVAAPSNSVDYS